VLNNIRRFKHRASLPVTLRIPDEPFKKFKQRFIIMHEAIIVLVTTFSFCSEPTTHLLEKKLKSRNPIGEFIGKVCPEMMVSYV